MSKQRFKGQIEVAAENNDFNLVGWCVTDYQCRDIYDASMALIVATKKNNFAMAELLLLEGARRNETDDDGSTPLLIAVKCNFDRITRLLLKHKADVNVKDKNGNTPLDLALKNKNHEVVKRLNAYQNEEDTDVLDRFKGQIEVAAENNDFNLVGLCVTDYQCRDIYDASMALIVATKKNNFAMAELLLREGVRRNETDDDGSTPLLIAVKCNFDRITRLLLKHKADVNVKDKNGNTPLDLALNRKNQEVVKLLKAYQNGEGIYDLDREIESAAACGDIVTVSNYLKSQKLTVEHINKLLFTATEKNECQIVKLLLKYGANVHEKSQFSSSTPLLLAVKNNYPQIIQLLLKHGSDVNTRDKFGDSPLLCAVENRNVSVAIELIDSGADINITDRLGQNLILFAASEGCATLIPTLIKKGLDVNALDPKINSTALHKVIKVMRTDVFDNGAIDAINALLDAGCDTSVKTVDGNTALMVAMRNDFSRFSFPPTEYNRIFREQMSSTFDRFISNCNDFDDENIDGETALMWAAESGHLHHVKTLVEKGCSLKKQCDSKETALWFAVKANQSDIVKYLLNQGADCETPNGLFKVALFNETIEILIQYGCRVDGFTQLDILVKAIPNMKDALNILENMYNYGSCSESDILHGLTNPTLEWYWKNKNKEKVDWLSELCSKPRTLKSNCRGVIRRCLQKAIRLDRVDLLQVPSKVKAYLNHDIEDETFIEVPKPEPVLTEEQIQERKVQEFYEWADQFGFF